MPNNKKLKVVIDTNILLVSISTKSKSHWIFQKFLNKEFDLYISNDILSEYEEILAKKLPETLKKYTIDTLLMSKNVIRVIPYFNWQLITADPDDNKFVDCAVAGNVDYIITHDGHYKVLKDVAFPKINVISTDEFAEIFK